MQFRLDLIAEAGRSSLDQLTYMRAKFTRRWIDDLELFLDTNCEPMAHKGAPSGPLRNCGVCGGYHISANGGIGDAGKPRYGVKAGWEVDSSLDIDAFGSHNMDMNSHSYTRAFSTGLLMWLVGTIGVRLAGERVLHASHASRTLILYLVSFLLMAWLIPGICRRMGLERESWFKATAALILPTLLLDPFSCVFFATAFPNIDPAAAAFLEDGC